MTILNNPLKRLKLMQYTFAAFWTILAVVMMVLLYKYCKNGIMQEALSDAKISFKKDLAFRSWASMHGGVYVPVDSITQPNPYLAHIPDRDITTSTGKKLTLMNPAYMQRQIYEISNKQFGIIGHITSLKLMREENKPDEWERKALEKFEKGDSSFYEITDFNGEPALRYMNAVRAKKSCLKCHEYQGYKEGDVRGGISVTIPILKHQIGYSAILNLGIFIILLLWLLGLTGLFYAFRNLRKKIIEAELSYNASVENEEKFSTVFNAANDAIIISLFENGAIFDMNSKAEKLTGYNTTEINKTNINKLFSKEVCSKENSNYNQDLFLITKNKQCVPVEISRSKTSFGGDVFHVDIIRDITERKMHETELYTAIKKAEQSDRLKTSFLENMSHEIRTPLNGILGFSELMATKNISEEKKSKYLSIINKSGKHLLNIINDIIDISKIEAGIINLKKDKVNINDLLEEQKLFFSELIEESSNKQIEFKIEYQEKDKNTVLLTDSLKLQQILKNLLSNAVKFTENGSITVGFDKKIENGASFIEFFVKDTGIGIDENIKSVIFDRFRQGEEGLSRQFGGTGLGLYISKSLAVILGGHIWVNSVKGKGSEFRFILPHNESEKEENQVKTTQNSYRSAFDFKYKILIVEDDDTNSFFIEEIADELELLYDRAINGKIAVDKINEGTEYALVLMDIKMPEMNGIEATKIIKEKHPELPIIIQTAFAFQNEKDKCFEAGCNDYLSKPISTVILQNLIQKYLPEA